MAWFTEDQYGPEPRPATMGEPGFTGELTVILCNVDKYTETGKKYRLVIRDGRIIKIKDVGTKVTIIPGDNYWTHERIEEPTDKIVDRAHIAAVRQAAKLQFARHAWDRSK
jgi:hypothetical protein